MGKKVKNYNKIRSIRLSDEVWKDFSSRKLREQDWELYIKDLLSAIDSINKFGKK